MYKILIVDDEGIVIDSLSYMIKKQYKDICEIETAKSGRRAIELVELYKPDLIFMDISMPGINGIDAIKEINKNNPNILYVILSAYDKFMYAKEAINLRVVEYLLKPVNKQTIITTIDKAIAMIESKRKQHSHELKVKEKLETVIPILENGLIYTLLFHKKNQEELESYKNLLDMTSNYGYIMIFEFGESLKGNHVTNPVGSSVRTQLQYDRLREFMKENYQCIIGSVMLNRVTVYVEYNSNRMDYEARNSLVEKTRTLVIQIRRTMDLYCRVGIGSVYSFEDSSNSYDEAVKGLFHTNSSVIHIEDIQETRQNDKNDYTKIEQGMVDSIELGDIVHTESKVRYYFDFIKNYYGNEMEYIKIKLLETLLSVEKKAYLEGTITYQMDEKSSYLKRIFELNNEEDLYHWFLEHILKICRKIKDKQRTNSNTVIHNAVEYIKQNYKEELSLESISKKFNVSSYYFSRLFKEEIGDTFVEYLTSIRIAQAKLLLRTTDYSMKEICIDVGYGDPNYFSRIFKKNVGVTPSEYREGEL